MSYYDQIPALPPDPIFGLNAEYKADARPNKFTFVTGYFCAEDLSVPLLETVAEVEKSLSQKKLSRGYLPIEGDPEYVEEMGKLAFGKNWDPSRICGVQTIGGTGALYLVGRLANHWTNQIAISSPTWVNHWNIFSLAGLKTIPYPYYASKSLLFDEFLNSLSKLSQRSCVLIHTNCHNPTGFDLSKEQWIEVFELLDKKKLFPILDMAYQGFSGTPEEDAFPVHLFYEKGSAFALTYTCAKNFSIYSERAGALFIVDPSSKKTSILRTQLQSQIRGSYSNPPFHAAAIVKTILSSPDLKKRWLKELEVMRQRMQKIRNQFIDELMQKDPAGNWEKCRRGKGLFFYSEVSRNAVERLRKDKGLYLATDGRINLTGLNQNNLGMFVEALIKFKNV